MLRLANPNVGPPGSFRLRDANLAEINPRLADVGPFHALRDLENEVNRRRTANGLTPLSSDEVQDRLCQHLPPGYCQDEMGHKTLAAGSMALTLSDVLQGTATLTGWFARGRRRVSKDEIVRRSYLCNQCPHHVPINGCQGCSGHQLRSLISEVVANESLPTDGMLGGCAVCKCSLVPKVRMPIDDLLPHMSSDQKNRLWDRCWLREEQ